MSPEFESDAVKAEADLERHGMAFEEARTVFADPVARIFDDAEHSARAKKN